MKKIIKKSFIVCLCLLLALSMTACAKKGTLEKPLNLIEDFKTVTKSSFVAAQNEKFELRWDSEHKRVVFYDKEKDVSWCATPSESMELELDEYGYEITNNPRIEAPFMITYVETTNFTEKNANPYVQSLGRGDYALESVENGLKITYFLKNLEIMIPVVYKIQNDSFSVSIQTNEIRESGINRLYKISLAPFMCSVPNKTEGSYLVHPSGSGALIYTNREFEVGIPNEYDIYGLDGLYITPKNANFSNVEDVKLPIYGVKNGDKALLAVVSSGAEIGQINTDVGDAVTGYSNIYSSYYIRGITSTKKALTKVQYSEEYPDTLIEVKYFPLYNEDANYISMANKYREFLEKEKGLTDLKEDAALSLSLIGGTQTPTSILGIPTTKIFATTTVKQAGEIIKDLNSSTGLPIVADLFGFGTSGVDVGKPGGGLKVGSSFGSDKELKKLSAELENSGNEVYFNYDMLNFSENGSGLTTVNGGAAKNPSHLYSRMYAFSLGDGSPITTQFYYRIGRLELFDFSKKVVSHASKLGVTGITSHNLTNTAYSDFIDNKTIAKANMANDVSAILANVKQNDLKVLGNSANDYAAVASDRIIEVPITSNKYNLFDVDIPFYQIVFKGYIPMYSTALNTITDERTALLSCVESGTGLRYSVINTYDVVLATSKYQIFATRLYSDVKDVIIANVNQTKDFYTAVIDAKIVDHVVVNKDVRKVVYDNGVTVFVNYGDSEYQSELGTVAAESFIFGKGAN